MIPRACRCLCHSIFFVGPAWAVRAPFVVPLALLQRHTHVTAGPLCASMLRCRVNWSRGNR